MNPNSRPWVQQQIHHFRKANLRTWRVHPAIRTSALRRWMATVRTDTPPLSVRSAYALTRLYRLEAYSAENAVLLTSSVCTARKLGWNRVCDLVGVPADRSQWPSYEFAGRDAVSKYFEDAFDELTRPFLDKEEENARCVSVYAQQCQEHESYDLARVLEASGWPGSLPGIKQTPTMADDN